MTLFWTIWASIILGILLLACLIELNGGRQGFHGANSIFMFASGVLAFFSVPVVFIVTWVWGDFWTAVKVCLTGAAIYAALFALAVHLLSRLGRSISAASHKR